MSVNRDYANYKDAKLVKLVAQGDRMAFDAIYYRHWESLYQSAYFILNDKDLSLDVVQDVFVWFWENQSNWNITTLKSYLKAAVKYKVANTLRSNKIHKKAVENIKNLEGRKVFSLEEELEIKELKAVILSFTNQLPQRCQQVFRLSRFDHLSNKEIADRLGITEKTVENQLTIALRKLRVNLNRMSFWLVFLM